jgi:hypothetical protein
MVAEMMVDQDAELLDSVAEFKSGHLQGLHKLDLPAQDTHIGVLL